MNELEGELNQILPADLPNREKVIQGTARHLALIVEANKFLNLTRITTPRDAAVKHVLDSVIPWRLFAKSKRVLREACGPSTAKGARGDAELSIRRPAVISHRVKPPSRAASILIERHGDDAARKLAFRGLYEARRLRSRIRFSFWTAVAAEIDARRLTARD